MTIDAAPAPSAEWTLVQAAATEHAVGAHAKEGNMRAILELSAVADSAQQAEHIRGVVATNVARLSTEATAQTRTSAAQWQTWALGLATEGAASP